MRLINPALLPGGRISELMILSEDSFDMAILLHACPKHLAIDYSLHELTRLNSPAQQVLLQRLERIAEPDEDELALLASLRAMNDAQDRDAFAAFSRRNRISDDVKAGGKPAFHKFPARAPVDR